MREPPEIRRVLRARAAVARAEADYRQAILTARAAGYTFEAIGAALGMSRQAIHKTLKITPARDPTKMLGTSRENEPKDRASTD